MQAPPQPRQHSLHRAVHPLRPQPLLQMSRQGGAAAAAAAGTDAGSGSGITPERGWRKWEAAAAAAVELLAVKGKGI